MIAMAAVIAQLFIPVGRPSAGRKVEDIPDRIEGAKVTRVLTGIRRAVQQFRAPEVPDLITGAVKDRHHRHLNAFRRFSMVIAFEIVFRRRQQMQVLPAALLGKRNHAVKRSLRNHREVDPLTQSLRCSIQLV